ncbi:MAG: hypothetical protein IH849_07525 [Acidobacteria bacterium]|nr:hypothetical protein [Acidobacteriota bacterium]
MSSDHDHESTPDVLLAAAVAFELRPFARRLGVEALDSGLAHEPVGNRRVVLLSASMGRAGDEKFAAALRHLRPAAVINVGIAGALDLAHPAGSTWVVEEWRHQQHPHEPAAHADAALSADVGDALTETGIAWGNAVAVTVDEPLHDADERDRIREGSGAHLVEMEGAAWATIAAEHGVPFAAVRVVSDHADRPLPGPRTKTGRRAWLLRDDGTTRKRRLLLALLASTAWLRPRHHLHELKAAGGQFRDAVDALDGVARALLAHFSPPE